MQQLSCPGGHNEKAIAVGVPATLASASGISTGAVPGCLNRLATTAVPRTAREPVVPPEIPTAGQSPVDNDRSTAAIRMVLPEFPPRNPDR